MPDPIDRRAIERDHDLLTRIDANLSNFMKRFEDHVAEDKNHFDRLHPKISRLEKFFWMAMGAMTVLELIIKTWK